MLVLGIETSTPNASVAIASQTEVVGSYELGRGKSQDQVLMPATERLLEDAGLDWQQLGGVAVGLGPGMFTGLRVGITTGKAVAQALGISIVGLGSMDVLAHRVRFARRLICVCTDARRREIFWAFYRGVPGGVQKVSDFRCGPAEHCANEIEARSEPVLLVGGGAHLYPRAFEDASGDAEIAGVGASIPTARGLAELGVALLMREEGDHLPDVRPLYVRKSDAEMSWEAANG
jgi:tRNA threonylcarbamoyladenosine biosynthesis protein TsaB